MCVGWRLRSLHAQAGFADAAGFALEQPCNPQALKAKHRRWRLTDADAGNPHPSRELLAQLHDDLSLDKERLHKTASTPSSRLDTKINSGLSEPCFFV